MSDISEPIVQQTLSRALPAHWWKLPLPASGSTVPFAGLCGAAWSNLKSASSWEHGGVQEDPSNGQPISLCISMRQCASIQAFWVLSSSWQSSDITSGILLSVWEHHNLVGFLFVQNHFEKGLNSLMETDDFGYTENHWRLPDCSIHSWPLNTKLFLNISKMGCA